VKKIYQKVSEGKVYGGGDYLSKDGKYLLVLTGVRFDETRNGDKFFGDVVVVSAEQVGDEAPHPKGAAVSVCYSIGDAREDIRNMSISDTKKFVAALFGKDVNELRPRGYKDADGVHEFSEFEETCEEIDTPEQPTKGMLIIAESYHKTVQSGKNAGTVNTYFKFFPVSDDPTLKVNNSAAQIKARREQLEFTEAAQ
jgi:hypothetical protein